MCKYFFDKELDKEMDCFQVNYQIDEDGEIFDEKGFFYFSNHSSLRQYQRIIRLEYIEEIIEKGFSTGIDQECKYGENFNFCSKKHNVTIGAVFVGNIDYNPVIKIVTVIDNYYFKKNFLNIKV